MSDRPELHDPNDRPAQQPMERSDKFEQPTPAIPRPFGTTFSPDFLSSYHAGTMRYTYKGVACLKNPIDLALYIKLIWDYRPASIIEIGSFEGGAASFYADLCHVYGLETQIVTSDFRNIQQHSDNRVTFVQADALHIEQSRLHDLLQQLPRPWLVIEDSAHTSEVCRAVIDYFGERMVPGEILIIEDGVIEDQGANCNYNGGPNRAVQEYFGDYPDNFRVMSEYTDFFGYNATFNPNGFLQKL